MRTRVLRAAAWLLMALSLVVVFTGYVVGPTQTGHAQQAPGAVPRLATGVGDDGHPVPPPWGGGGRGWGPGGGCGR